MSLSAQKFNRNLYNSWHGMLRRCNDVNAPFFKDYGGRGITVSGSWSVYETFLQDMLSSWGAGLTLERIDNNKGYCKENCRWATKTEQANNRRNSTAVYFQGKTRTLAQWVKLLGLKGSTVRQRYYVYKWTIEEALLGR